MKEVNERPITELNISSKHGTGPLLFSPVYSKIAIFSYILSFFGSLNLFIFLILSYLVGIKACFFGSSIAVVSGILSIILGVIGIRNINRKPYILKGYKMAIAGIIYSSVDIVVVIIFIWMWQSLP